MAEVPSPTRRIRRKIEDHQTSKKFCRFPGRSFKGPSQRKEICMPIAHSTESAKTHASNSSQSDSKDPALSNRQDSEFVQPQSSRNAGILFLCHSMQFRLQ